MRALLFGSALSLAIAACAGGQSNQSKSNEGSGAAHPKAHAELTWAEVKTAQEAGAVLVDARGAASYDKGHIPGAISVPVRDDAAASRLPTDTSTRLIFYCGGPRCPASTRAAEKASAAGYTNVADFRGGYPAWQARYGLDGSVDRPVPDGITLLEWPAVEASMAAGAILADSRSPAGFAKGHIKGAINVPYKDDAAYGALPADKAVALIFYCSGPVCSASTKGAEKARALGYAKVHEYRGGYPDWASRQ
ncbi:MAG: rhodanese-like domain-containing protein [Myxococcota bacterium]|jgi:rhodanese-related sulfurtransferase|nr:rhodanese-like domain-containing protein [Myxococcota bacterium]